MIIAEVARRSKESFMITTQLVLDCPVDFAQPLSTVNRKRSESWANQTKTSKIVNR